MHERDRQTKTKKNTYRQIFRSRNGDIDRNMRNRLLAISSNNNCIDCHSSTDSCIILVQSLSRHSLAITVSLVRYHMMAVFSLVIGYCRLCWQ